MRLPDRVSPAFIVGLSGVLIFLLTVLAPAGEVGPKATKGCPQFTWEPIGLSGGGMIWMAAISPVDPDLMMVGCDMSGVYITTDGARHWRMIHHEQLRDNLACRPGFHPKDKRVIYASYGNTGLRVSRDTGAHWSTLGPVPGGFRGEIRLDPDYPETILIGGDDGASISHDEGKTWRLCEGPTGPGVSFAFDRSSPRDARVIFAATTRGVWRSDDGGKTWAPKTNGLPHERSFTFVADWYGRSPRTETTELPQPYILSFAGASDPKTGLTMLYCSTPSKSENGEFRGGVYRSRDLGEHWEWAMANGINKDTHVYGDVWTPGPVPEYRWVLAADAKPLTVYTMNTGTGLEPPHHTTAFRSDDGGDNWRPTLYLDPRFPEFNLSPPDYGTATEHRAMLAWPFAAAIANSDPERVLYAEGAIWVTRNGGRTWEPGHTALAPGQKAEPGAAWVCNGLMLTGAWHYYTDPFQPKRHYIAYTDIGIATSDDAAETWRWWRLEGRAPWINTCYELAFDPEVPGEVWGAFADVHNIPMSASGPDEYKEEVDDSRGPGGVCLSTDSGETWQALKGGLPKAPCTSVVLDPRSPKGRRTLYAAFYGEGVYKSDDDGKTWVRKSRGLGAPENLHACRLILYQDGTLFALVTAKRQGGEYLEGGAGLWRSRDGGESWECITTSVGLLWPKDFSVSPQSSEIIFLGASNAGNQQGGLYRTIDGGKTWQRVSRQGVGHFGAYFDPKRPGWAYATVADWGNSPTLWLTRDNGDTWEAFEEFPFIDPLRVEFDPADPDVIYVTTWGGGVWRGRMID